MSVFLLRDFLHSDVLQERNYSTTEEVRVRLFHTTFPQLVASRLQVFIIFIYGFIIDRSLRFIKLMATVCVITSKHLEIHLYRTGVSLLSRERFLYI